MSKTTFPYTSHTDRVTFDTIYRPLVPVKLSVGTTNLPLSFLIDSGAYATVINAEIAPALGIDLASCPLHWVEGIGGQVEGRLHGVRIYVGKFKRPMDICAVFVVNLGIDGLLGQRDFFRNYYVRFEQPECSFTIEEVPVLEWGVSETIV
jgi:hypothetical protein